MKARQRGVRLTPAPTDVEVLAIARRVVEEGRGKELEDALSHFFGIHFSLERFIENLLGILERRRVQGGKAQKS